MYVRRKVLVSERFGCRVSPSLLVMRLLSLVWVTPVSLIFQPAGIVRKYNEAVYNSNQEAVYNSTQSKLSS